MGVEVRNGGLGFVAGLDLTELERNAARIPGIIGNASSAVRDQSKAIEDIANKASQAVKAYFSIQAATNFVQQIVKVRGEFEQLQVAYTTILGNKQQADKLFAETVKLAQTTPFNLLEVAKSTKQLLAYGFGAEEVTGTLSKLGDVAAGVSQPIGDIAYLYGTLKTQGRAYAIDIRQFTGRGIPIVAELAKQFDTTSTNVMKLVEAGKVGFPEIEKAFNSLTGAGGQFFNLMAAQSLTVTGQISNLQDQFDQLLNDIGRENQGLITGSIAGLASMIENYQQIIDTIEVLVISYGAYRAAVFVSNAYQKAALTTQVPYTLALNAESVAKIANAEASATMLRSEISALAVKKATTLETAAADRALLVSAQERLAAAVAARAASQADIYSSTASADAKAVLVAEEQVLAAQEKASISRKAALGASSQFYATKLELEVVAKEANAAASLELTAAETLQTGVTIIAAKAYDVLTASMLTNPYVALTIGFAAMAASLYNVSKQTNYAGDAAEKYAEALGKEQTKLGQLFQTLEDTKAGTEERRKAVVAIKDAYGEYLPKMDLEKANLSDIRDAYEQVNQKITENIALKAKQDQNQLLGEDFAKKQAKIIKQITDQIADDLGDEQAGRASVLIGRFLSQALNGSIKLGAGNIGGSEGRDLINQAQKYASQLTAGKDTGFISDYLNQLQAVVDQQRRAKSSLDAFYKGVDDTSKVGKKKLSDAQAAAIAFAEALAKPVENFNTLMSTQTGKKDLEAVQKALEDQLDVPGITVAKINQIKVLQDKVDEALKIYSRKVDNTQKKLESQEESERTRRNRIFDKIGKVNEEALENSKTQDEKEVLQARAKYDELLTEIDRFNASKKNKTKIDPTRINIGGKVTNLNQAADQAGEAVRIRQQFEIERQGYDAQKQVFKDYEDYKNEVGEEAAQKRYQNDIKGFQSYVKYLENLQSNVAGKGDLNSVLVQNFLKTELPKARTEEINANREYVTKLIKDNISYEEERKQIVTKGFQDRKKLIEAGDQAGADQLAKSIEDRLTTLDKGNFESLRAYKEVFSGLYNLTSAEAKKNLDALQGSIDKALKAGDITEEAYRTIKKAIVEANKAIDDKAIERLQTMAGAISQIASSVSGLSEGVGSIIGAIGQSLEGLAQIKKLSADLKDADPSNDGAAEVGLVVAGITSAINLVSIFTNASKARKAAEEAYYASVLKSQNDLNLATNEQIRLRSELNKNIFFTDYKNQILDGALALADANEKFNQSLLDLQKGQAKLGQRDAVDANAIGKGLVSGATLGAVVGSVVPVIGTVAGAVVGGVIGAIGGLFGGKKKKDVFGGLLGEYPELIQKATDGTEKFNVALANNLIQNNLVDDSTKALLQNTIELNDARQAAIDQINSALTDLAGSLGEDLRNSLVGAFKDGSDAAKAFGEDVSKVLENIISQFLFNEIFKSNFDNLQKELKASFEFGGDQSLTDDIVRFYKDVLPKIDQYNEGLQAAKDAGKDVGLDIFGSTKAGSSQNSATGALRADLTEDTGSIIAGGIKGIQLGVNTTNNILLTHGLTLSQMMMIAQGNLNTAIQIELNTRKTATNTDVLPVMLDEIKQVNQNTKGSLDVELRAAGFYKY